MKGKIYGIGNDERLEFNHYTFEKTRKAHEILSELFGRIFEGRWDLNYAEENGEHKKIDISKNKDFHELLEGSKSIGEKPRIDIFYGNKKMFVTILCSQEKRNEFNRLLEDKFDFAEVEDETKK